MTDRARTKMKNAYAIVGVGMLMTGFVGCTSHKLEHNVQVDKPIHITLDINVTLKKEVEEDLSDLFGE